MNAREWNLLAEKYEAEGDEEMAYRCHLENALTEADGESLFALGHGYLFGIYVNMDLEKAGHYFKLAYEAGYKMPGYAYIMIPGCKEEKQTGTWESKMKWYRMAIENGCEYGHECIGCMYMEKGHYKEAIDCFLTPEIKNTSSLYNLGRIYDEGLGVEQDMEKAIEYYKRAVYDCWDVKDYGDDFFDKAWARLTELGIEIVDPACTQ